MAVSPTSSSPELQTLAESTERSIELQIAWCQRRLE